MIKEKEQLFYEKLIKYKTDEQNYIKKAYHFASEVHKNQLRYSGEPYIIHCINTALTLVNFDMDIDTIVSGLLHDVIEDTNTGIDVLADNFSSNVAHLVEGVTKIKKLTYVSSEERKLENYRKFFLFTAKDLRVIIIKLADRLDNMNSLKFIPRKDKRIKIAAETLDVYVPLASMLGMWSIKWRLQDLSFKTIENEKYREIERLVSLKRDQREKFVNNKIELIKKALIRENIEARIYGRPKNFYSIFYKITNSGKDFSNIFDLFALRIITKNEADCYAALGVLRSVWNEISNRYKDYISKPKSNGYQSLHATFRDIDNYIFEIQIRTEKMHEIAEKGLAAHWQYKGEKLVDDSTIQIKMKWFREFLEGVDFFKSPKEISEFLKINADHDKIYVYTPKGEAIEMAPGSTVLDFAFRIHTDIGMHCSGATIDERIVPLSTEIKNGQIIYIKTSDTQNPNSDWVNWVKTHKAKSKIRKYLKDKIRKEDIVNGITGFKKTLRKEKIPFPSKDQMKEILESLKINDENDFYVQFHNSKITYSDLEPILKKIILGIDEKKEEYDFEEFIEQRILHKRPILKIQGIDNMLIRYGQCCQPIPGDNIIGFITRGKGVTIHKTDCTNIVNSPDTERFLKVKWDTESTEYFEVGIMVTALPVKQNPVKDLTELLNSKDIKIVNLSLKKEKESSKMNVLIHVHNINHLRDIVKTLKKVSWIDEVRRKTIQV